MKHKELAKDGDNQLIMVGVGDPIEHVQTLYKLGLYSLMVESIPSPSAHGYRQLMRKYPSYRYILLADSLSRHPSLAYEAGIFESLLIGNHKHAVTLVNRFISPSVPSVPSLPSLPSIQDLNETSNQKLEEIEKEVKKEFTEENKENFKEDSTPSREDVDTSIS
jgi:hypothetical protein